MKRGYMRKFSLILSCFIAGTCGIERSTAKDGVTVQNVIEEGKKDQENLLNELKACSNDSIKLWAHFEDFALNKNTPYVSKVVSMFRDTILSNMGRIDQKILDKSVISSLLITIREDCKLNQKALSVALAEGIMSAACGALWNVEIDPDRKGHILRPQTETENNIEVFTSNPYEAIHKNLCEIKIENDLTNLKVKKMSDDERYVYNQNLGLLVWNAGLNAVETKLKSQLEQALRSNNNNLALAILAQIRNAYYWAMLRNPDKTSNLRTKYCKEYSKYKSHFKFKKYFSIEEIKFFSNFSDKETSALFQISDEVNFTKTKLGTQIKKADDVDILLPQLGTKITKGLTGNSCFAISGFAPLLAKGNIIDPRLELNLMEQSDEKNLDIFMDNYGHIDSVAKITESHFGYYIQEPGLAAPPYPFLPIHTVLNDNRHFEIICRSNFESKIKAELQERNSESFTSNFLKRYKQEDMRLQLANLLKEYQELQSKNLEIDSEITDVIKTVKHSYQEQAKGEVKKNDINSREVLEKIKSYPRTIIEEVKHLSIPNNKITIQEEKTIKDINNIINNRAKKTSIRSIIDLVEHPIFRKLEEIQELVKAINTSKEKNSYFQATPENSIDPLLPMFSQRTDNFAYRK